MSFDSVSFKQFVKNPLSAVLFLCLMAIGGLYLDNKKVYKEQLRLERLDKDELKERVGELEDKVTELHELVLKVSEDHHNE